MNIENTKGIVLSVLVTAILAVGATVLWQKTVDADSVLSWTDEAVNFFPMNNPANFAGVDTLGMNLQKVRVTGHIGRIPYRVDYIGDKGVYGHGEAAKLSDAVKEAVADYRRLQKEREK